MDGLDVLVFTAGIGENSALMRERICGKLSYLGVRLDPDVNARPSGEARVISTPDSKVAVLVVPTNEELVIARDTYRLARSLKSRQAD